MKWTAETPIYLPLTYPPSILAAARRLAHDAAAVFGAPPPLRPQPAPFGQPAILIGPDPAYSAAVAPYHAQTFAVLTIGDELTVTGADTLGTILGLAWLARAGLGIEPFDAWLGRTPPPRGAVEVQFDYEQPRWTAMDRVWAVDAKEVAALSPERQALLVETLLRCGGNALAVAGPPPEGLAATCAAAGVRLETCPSPTVPLAALDVAGAPAWW